MLNLRHLNFHYGEKKVLQDLSLDVKKGEIVALIGSSGCGKTTLLRLIMGLEPLQEGTMQIGGLISYMLQEDLLLPWRNLMENLLLFSPTEEERAQKLLQRVGLSSCHHLYPKQLSQGMRKRASMVRALLPNKPLLLLDEPFGALDLLLREQMTNLLLEFQKELDLTLLFTTHDFHEALFLSHRICLMADGKIAKEWTVPPSIREDPKKYFELQGEMREALSKDFS